MIIAKRKLLHRSRFATRAEGRWAIFARIDRYNSRHRQPTLCDIAWEQQYHQTKVKPVT